VEISETSKRVIHAKSEAKKTERERERERKRAREYDATDLQ